MTALKEKALSLKEYRDLRAKEKTLEELVNQPEEKERTIDSMRQATIAQLVFHMEHSRGMYAEYGANAFWSLCEALSYIFGEETWNKLYKEASQTRAGIALRHPYAYATGATPPREG